MYNNMQTQSGKKKIERARILWSWLCKWKQVRREVRECKKGVAGSETVGESVQTEEDN